MTHLVSTRYLDGSDKYVVEPQETAFDSERLLLPLVREHLPPSGCRAIVDKTSSARDGNQSAVRTYRGVPDGPIGRHVVLRDLDVLPYVRFGVDNAHVWLVCTAVHEHTIVHLEERILSVVLFGGQYRIA